MMESEITFEPTDIKEAMESLRQGNTVSAVRLLTLLEDWDEQAVQEAVQWLEDAAVELDISDLPRIPATGQAGTRLRMEEELVRSGELPAGLEEDDPLGIYLQELSQIPAAGDPEVLAQELLEGKDVQERLVSLMLSRVVEEAKKLTGRGMLLLDLIQEGSLGLWQGLLYYTGGDITAHCDRWIRQYMARAVTLQAGAAGLGQKLRQSLTDYVEVDQRLLTELGRNPTTEEIAQQMHISEAEALTLEKMLQNARSRQAVEAARQPRQEDPEDQQAVEDTAYFQTRQAVDTLLSGLEPEEKKLLALRYGLEGGKPLDPGQTGIRMGLTAKEVLEKETAILAKLRN